MCAAVTSPRLQRVAAPIRSLSKVGRARTYEALGSHRYAYPALKGLDRRVIELLPQGSGTFLEIGANDGYSQSNTYHLERFKGWRGILVEPLPSLFVICRAHRRRSRCYNVACVSDGGPPSIDLVDRGLMSVALGLQAREEEARRVPSGLRRVTVPTRTLSWIIDDSGFTDIDFMSIDVEGSELSVLGGLDLQRHVPRFLLVETEHPRAVDELLGGVLDRTRQLTFHDYLYERRE